MLQLPVDAVLCVGDVVAAATETHGGFEQSMLGHKLHLGQSDWRLVEDVHRRARSHGRHEVGRIERSKSRRRHRRFFAERGCVHFGPVGRSAGRSEMAEKVGRSVASVYTSRLRRSG